MPRWIILLILMAICGLAGVAIGFILGFDWKEAEEWRRKNE